MGLDLDNTNVTRTYRCQPCPANTAAEGLGNGVCYFCWSNKPNTYASADGTVGESGLACQVGGT
jgi:hypothetical protein